MDWGNVELNALLRVLADELTDTRRVAWPPGRDTPPWLARIANVHDAVP